MSSAARRAITLRSGRPTSEVHHVHNVLPGGYHFSRCVNLGGRKPPESPPKMSDHPITVVAAVIRCGDRYLVCRRPPQKRHGGMWEFPGGKVDDGEDLAQAAARELDEELSLTAQSFGQVLFSAQDKGSPFLIQFLEVQATGTPVLHEHTEVCWATVQELGNLSLAPVDRLFVEHMETVECSSRIK